MTDLKKKSHSVFAMGENIHFHEDPSSGAIVIQCFNHTLSEWKSNSIIESEIFGTSCRDSKLEAKYQQHRSSIVS